MSAIFWAACITPNIFLILRTCSGLTPLGLSSSKSCLSPLCLKLSIIAPRSCCRDVKQHCTHVNLNFTGRDGLHIRRCESLGQSTGLDGNDPRLSDPQH